MLKFQCQDKDGKFIGTVNGKDQADALTNAQKLNDDVVKVVPMNSGPGPETLKSGGKAKKNKAPVEVAAESAPPPPAE